MEMILLWVVIVLPIVFTVVEMIGITEGKTSEKIKWGLFATFMLSFPFLIALINK